MGNAVSENDNRNGAVKANAADDMVKLGRQLIRDGASLSNLAGRAVFARLDELDSAHAQRLHELLTAQDHGRALAAQLRATQGLADGRLNSIRRLRADRDRLRQQLAEQRTSTPADIYGGDPNGTPEFNAQASMPLSGGPYFKGFEYGGPVPVDEQADAGSFEGSEGGRFVGYVPGFSGDADGSLAGLFRDKYLTVPSFVRDAIQRAVDGGAFGPGFVFAERGGEDTSDELRRDLDETFETTTEMTITMHAPPRELLDAVFGKPQNAPHDGDHDEVFDAGRFGEGGRFVDYVPGMSVRDAMGMDEQKTTDNVCGNPSCPVCRAVRTVNERESASQADPAPEAPSLLTAAQVRDLAPGEWFRLVELHGKRIPSAARSIVGGMLGPIGSLLPVMLLLGDRGLPVPKDGTAAREVFETTLTAIERYDGRFETVTG